MGFSRQEYWSGLPCPDPPDLPDPGIKPMSLTSPALAGRFFTTSTTWEALGMITVLILKMKKLRLKDSNLLEITDSQRWTEDWTQIPLTPSYLLLPNKVPATLRLKRAQLSMSVGQQSRPSFVVSSVSRCLTAAVEVSARAIVS